MSAEPEWTQHLVDLMVSDAQLLDTVNTMPDDAFTQPSLLPDWSRAHVIAHLALNAEALTRVMHGLAQDQELAMYPSQEARNVEVAELAPSAPAKLRDRLRTSTSGFAAAAAVAPPEGWSGTFPRLVGGPPFMACAEIAWKRHSEVVIHHADLGWDYSPSDWTPRVADHLLAMIVGDRTTGDATTLQVTDRARHTLTIGSPDSAPTTTVSGATTDLTWWLLGRGHGKNLSADPQLPELGAWR